MDKWEKIRENMAKMGLPAPQPVEDTDNPPKFFILGELAEKLYQKEKIKKDQEKLNQLDLFDDNR